jgi:hypothetical protein
LSGDWNCRTDKATTKSAAQRQAEFRARRTQGEGTDERLNTLVSVQAKRALERLATCYGVTQRAMLERVLRDAERAALLRAEGTPEGCNGYLYGRLRLEPVTQ